MLILLYLYNLLANSECVTVSLIIYIDIDIDIDQMSIYIYSQPPNTIFF